MSAGLGETLAQFDRVQGTFQPVRTDDLKAEARDFIGRAGEWQALWIIEHGPYAGQWAMGAPRDWHGFPEWAPLCDLALAPAQAQSAGEVG